MRVTHVSLVADHSSSADAQSLFPADYRIVQDGCTGALLSPGEKCVVVIVHRPLGPGDRPAAVRLDHDAPGSPAIVFLSGSGQRPSLGVSPDVARSGRVSIATGSGFPAGKPVRLSLDGTPFSITVTTGPDGSFSSPVLLFPNQESGKHQVTARFAGVTPTLVARAPILIEMGAVQPPEFVSRG
jgi:hypothetical protein